MKNVKRTKAPSVPALQKMAWNLREKFNVYCTIAIKSSAFTDAFPGVDAEFTIYVAASDDSKDPFSTFNSWKELQDGYFTLMEGR